MKITYDDIIKRTWCGDWDSAKILEVVFGNDDCFEYSIEGFFNNSELENHEKLAVLMCEDYLSEKLLDNLCMEIILFSKDNSNQSTYVIESREKTMLKMLDRKEYGLLVFSAEGICDGSIDYALENIKELFNVVG